MNYKYKVTRIIRQSKERDETGPIVGPEAFDMAMRQAQFWAGDLRNKTVTLLRADTEGINADKFFLHQIIK